MWKRNLTLAMSYAAAYAKLAKFADISSNHSKSPDTQSGNFVIYRSIAYRRMRNIYAFRFSCMLSQESNKVLLIYQVRPLLPFYCAAIFLGVALFLGIVDLLMHNGSWLFLLLCFLFNVAFWIYVTSQARECMILFEREFGEQEDDSHTSIPKAGL